MSVDGVDASKQPRPARPVRDRLGGDPLAVAKPDTLNAHTARRNGERAELRGHPGHLQGLSGALRGAPCHAELVVTGEKVELNRVAHLMAEDGLEGCSPRRRSRSTTKARPGVVGKNLLDRQFAPEAPNEAWVTDTTYLTTEDGPAFLVAILDLFSRRVVGRIVGAKQDTELAREALRKALVVVRQPRPASSSTPTAAARSPAIPSARNSNGAGARRSLSRPGECSDNAPAESFFGTLKDELELDQQRPQPC